VSASLERGQLTLAVRDNGLGIPEAVWRSAEEPPGGNGQGIPSMRERTRLLGGSLAFERPSAGGTLVIVAIPVPPGDLNMQTVSSRSTRRSMRGPTITGTVLFLTVVAAVPGLAQAPPKPALPPTTIGAELDAVNVCVRQIRRATGRNTLNAHFRPDGRLRVMGTEEEKLAFKRCLEQRGYPAAD
jgi:hypothetical protein